MKIHNQSIIVSVLFVACATIPLQNIDAASKFASHAKWLKRGILIGTGCALVREYACIEKQKTLPTSEKSLKNTDPHLDEQLQHRAKQYGITQPSFFKSSSPFDYRTAQLTMTKPPTILIPFNNLNNPNMFAITHEFGHVANNDAIPQKRMLNTIFDTSMYVYCASLYKWKSIRRIIPFIVGQATILAGTNLGLTAIKILYRQREEQKADQFAIDRCNAQELFEGIDLLKCMKNHIDQIIKNILPAEYNELFMQESLPEKASTKASIHPFVKFLFTHRYSLLSPYHPRIDKRIALLTQKAHEKAIQENNKDIISKTKKMLDELEHEKK